MSTAAFPEDEPMTRPRVVIADAHAGVRTALESLILLSGAGVVVGGARDLATAGQLSRRQCADVLLVDADLLADQHRTLGPLSAAATIVAIGMERHPAAAALAAQRGATSYVVKDQAHTELPAVLRAVKPRGAPSRSRRG